MEIVIDIETLPGDLDRREQDLKEVAETTKLSCNLTKGKIIEELGDPQLKYKTLDELRPLWIEANKEAAVEEAYRKRAIDGTYGNICSIAFGHASEDRIYSTSRNIRESELEILLDFNEMISSACVRKDGKVSSPTFVGHNVVFDLKFLFRRFAIRGLRCPVALPFGGWHGKDYYCTSQAWCGRDGRISQDNLCKALAIEGKPEGISGSNVYDHALAGNWSGIEEYNIDDVEKCREIYRRLT